MSNIALDALNKIRNEMLKNANALSNGIMKGGQGERLNFVLGSIDSLNTVMGWIAQAERQIQGGDDVQIGAVYQTQKTIVE